MHRCLLFFVLFALIGCPEPNKGFPPIPPPKDTVLLEPGKTDEDAPKEFTKTESGLKYRILRKSDGNKPTENDTVRVHYRLTLDNGSIVDSSYGKTGRAIEFPLNAVIKGWTEGMQFIGEGGMIELEIPPELGYGSTKQSKIPANSTLHFIVELLDIKTPAIGVKSGNSPSKSEAKPKPETESTPEAKSAPEAKPENEKGSGDNK